MQLQVMLDCQKKFQDVFMEMLNLMNDTQILHLSSLYVKAVNEIMFHFNWNEEDIKPYLIVNKGYPLFLG